MELKIGDLLITQDYNGILRVAVVTKINKVTYTVSFLVGGTDTVNKKTLTTYGGYYNDRRYIPYKGEVNDALFKELANMESMAKELESCKNELFTAKCLLNRLLEASKPLTDNERHLIEEVSGNVEYMSYPDYPEDDYYDDDDDDWDYGDDPEDDDEPQDDWEVPEEEWDENGEYHRPPEPGEKPTTWEGDSLEAKETDEWLGFIND